MHNHLFYTNTILTANIDNLLMALQVYAVLYVIYISK